MPQLDHYNHNAHIAFPFVVVPQTRRLGSWGWTDDIVVDAGFVVEARRAAITLVRIAISKPKATFIFATGGLFMPVEVDLTAETGTVFRNSDTLWDGFLVVGAGLTTLARYPDGSHTLYPTLELEPGCSQWLHDAWVSAIDLANRKDGDATLHAVDLVGDVPFQPGYNAAVAVRPDRGTLEIYDDPGGGLGTPCFPIDAGEMPCAGFITTINGNGPDASGDFELVGLAGVEVNNFPEQHLIVVDFTKALVDKTCET